MKQKINHEFSGEINGQRFNREEVYESVCRILENMETVYGVDSSDKELTEILHDIQENALNTSRNGNNLIWQNEQTLESLSEIKEANMTDLIEKLEDLGLNFEEYEEMGI